MDELTQVIYHHGGSRAWYENEDGTVELVVDTYQDAEFAKRIKSFIEGEPSVPVRELEEMLIGQGYRGLAYTLRERIAKAKGGE